MTRPTFLLSTALFALCFQSFGMAQVMPADPKPAAPKVAARASNAPASAAPKPGGEAPASIDDIRQLVSDGKHREALQKLSRVLALKGDAAGQYDRHELLRLKAESHLNIKDTAAAASAFAAAAKEAPDDAARAQDKASELVVKRSKNLQFTPKPAKKGGKTGPFDITTMESRKEAFAALLEEEKAAAGPALKNAKAAKSLPPIVDGLKKVGDLRMLELAATGADAEATKLIEGLAGQAHKLMDQAVQDMTSLVNDVERSANDVQPVAVPARGPGGRGSILYQSAKRRGLTTRDTQDLKRTIADLEKLVPIARDLAESVGEAGKQFEKVADDGETVGNQAQKVLTTDYGDTPMRSEGLRRPPR